MEKKTFKVRIVDLQLVESYEERQELRRFIDACLSKGIKITNREQITKRLLE